MEPIPQQSASPKYALAELAILDRIEDGSYGPGERIPSVRELAGRLRIAPNTVQQALSRLVEQGILERRPRIGTFVRHRTAPTNVAVLIFHVPVIGTHSITWNAIQALQAEFAPLGRQVRPLHIVEPYPTAAQLYAELRTMKVGAVAYLGFINTDRPLIKSLSGLIPGVLLLKGLPGVSLPCVMPDARRAARLIVDHLVERGRRHIGVCGINTEHDFHMELSHALLAEMAAHGLPVNRKFWIESVGIPPDGWYSEEAERLISAAPRPDAMICLSGREAIDTALVMQRRGERIGREMDFVVFYSGTDIGTRHMDPWPVMALNYAASAAVGARLLREIVEAGEATTAPLVHTPPQLILPVDA